MGYLAAIATNDYSEYEAHISVARPRIKKSYWSSDKAGKNKIERARLEETVYFHIETEGIPNGSVIDLQLFDEDAFFDDCEFCGKKVFEMVVINEDKGVVELYLPDEWASDLALEEWNFILITSNLHYRDLYWKATYKKSMKNEKIKTILQIRYSNNQLYIKPSKLDETFPEIYSNIGEQIIVLVNTAGNEVVDSIKKSTKKTAETYAETAMKNAAHNYAVGKVSKGYMVTNDGVEYGPTVAKGTERKLQDIKFISKDGRYIETEQGYDFYSKKKSGKLVTTKGVDQYEYHYNQQSGKEHANKDAYYKEKAGCKIKVLGALSKTGAIMDIFSVFSFAANPSRDKPLPIPGADILGMIAYDQINEMETFLNEWQEMRIKTILDEAKREGLNKVKDVIYNKGNAYPEFRNADYELLEISPEIGSRIMQGEFNKIEEIIDASYDCEKYEKIITLLYRNTKHPISDINIALIETFFIKE